MKVEETEIAGVLEISPRRFADDRGWFAETWNSQKFADAGLDLRWMQDNESFSAQAGTLRGVHFQAAPHAQDKLVRVVQGRIFDVAVDLRRSSATFRQWVGRELSSEAGNQLFVPRGFGHGFVTLTPDCQVAYKTSALYNGGSDRVVAWDDPSIGISWPINADEVVLSEKDGSAPLLSGVTDLFD